MTTPKHNPQADRETVRIFWRAGLRYKRLLWLSLLFPAGVILLNVLSPLFIGKSLAALTRPDGNPTYYLILFTISASLGLIANRFGHPALMTHQAYTMGDLQTKTLTTLLRRSVGFHNNNVGGKIVSDALDYTSSYGQIANAAIMTLLPFSLTLIFGTAIIFVESWILGLFITAMTATVIGMGVRDSRRMQPLRMERLAAGKRVTAHLADAITNVQTVKTFAREDQELSTHTDMNSALTDIRRTHWRLMSTRGNTRMIIVVLFQIAFVAVTIYAVQRDPALLGVGIFAFTFTLMLSNRLFEVNLMLRTIEDGLLEASPITEIMLETPEIQDEVGAKALKVKKGAIELKTVDFEYSDSAADQRVFKNLNLDIRAGEKIGLVGPSGGGKSTLTRLLLRFDDITNGEILIDGQDITKVTQSSLRESISYVPQEPMMFHRTVQENIAYGKPKASIKQIRAAARAAHADKFIEQLTNGYDTIVGERGVKLSGGQRQRVAIARAILKDAPILVLDEATSALDSESEVLIQDALWKLMQGRTALVIAHRLSTIQKMDRIIVLDNGKIAEEGTHKQLLARKGLYAKLWGHQSGGFIED